MAHRTATVIAVVAAGGLLALSGFDCAQQSSHAQPGEVRYRLSTDPTEQVLAATVSPGLIPWHYEYHLYGDGRLVREVVREYDKPPEYRRVRTVLATDEVRLSAAELDKVIRPLAMARPPWLAPALVQELSSRSPVQVVDGGGVWVRIKFAEYESPGRAPLESTISMDAPGNLARTVPGLSEARAASDVPGNLDRLIPRSLRDALAASNKPGMSPATSRSAT